MVDLLGPPSRDQVFSFLAVLNGEPNYIIWTFNSFPFGEYSLRSWSLVCLHPFRTYLDTPLRSKVTDLVMYLRSLTNI